MIDYDPLSEQVIIDPHPVYRRLRAESPVHYMEKYRCWVFARFKDIWDASSDTENFTSTLGTAVMQLCTKDIGVLPSLNTVDPPIHTEIRGHLRRYFMPRAVARIESELRSYASALFESFLDEGQFDAVRDLAAPVSLRAACIVNGFPVEDEPLLQEMVQRYFHRERGVIGMPPDAIQSVEDMLVYLQDLVRRRRAASSDRDDPISAYLSLEIEGRRLGDEEIASHLTLLLMGAVETFPKVFASAALRLFQNPDQRTRVVHDLGRVPDAFWEALRIDMPTQHLGRTAIKDVTVGGRTLRAGDPVLFLFASANRDEQEFENPDVFDVDRKARRILGFGQGTHRCLGANVAAMEGKVLLEELLTRIPDYHVDEQSAELLWTEFVMGYAKLPIKFDHHRSRLQ